MGSARPFTSSFAEFPPAKFLASEQSLQILNRTPAIHSNFKDNNCNYFQHELQISRSTVQPPIMRERANSDAIRPYLFRNCGTSQSDWN